MNFYLTDFYTWLMCLTRLVALLYWLPMFSGSNTPKTVRIALAGLISFTFLPFLRDTGEVPVASIEVAMFMAKEIIVGAMMGFAVRIIFVACDFAGQVISQEAGLAMSSSFDPNSGSTNTNMGTMLFYLTALVLFILEIHHDIFYAVLRSYSIVPIGLTFPGIGGIQNVVKDTSLIFIIGMQMAAPIIAINFVINLTFAVFGKAAPKVNVFITSFAVRIVVSFFLLIMIIGLFAQYLQTGLSRVPERMLQFLIP